MKSLKNTYAVIMAGGGGTRLWPFSKRKTPKQMLKLLGDQSIFQMTVNRIKDLIPPERIFVVTIEEQAKQLYKQCPEIPFENFLLEPMPKGTAAVVGFAAVAIEDKDPDGKMVILTADHFIKNQDKFHQLLVDAVEIADEEYLVTLGIEPTFAATGYGYIQKGEKLSDKKQILAYNVVRFKEKPDKNSANQFLEQGDHVWNSGMFIWNVKTILKEFERQMPALYQGLEKIKTDWHSPDHSEIIEDVWQEIVPETIDYGIMENANKIAVISAHDLGWNDVGSWDSLFEVYETDEEGNLLLHDNLIQVDTKNSLVFSKDPGKLIVSIGLEDIIIVQIDDVIMVCDRKKAQDVKKVVDILKSSGREEYL